MRQRVLACLALSTFVLAAAPAAAEADPCMCAAQEQGSEWQTNAPVPAHNAPEPVLWCDGTDDPRCMPIGGNGPDTPQPIPSSRPLGGPSALQALGGPGVKDVALWRDGGGPREGVRSRIERPPQPDRRTEPRTA